MSQRRPLVFRAAVAGYTGRMQWRGPLADSYAAAVALVVCALVPFLVLAGALTPLLKLIGKDLGLSQGRCS